MTNLQTITDSKIKTSLKLFDLHDAKPRTIKAYKENFPQFLRFCADQGLINGTLSPGALKSYKEYLRETDYAVATKNLRLTSAKLWIDLGMQHIPAFFPVNMIRVKAFKTNLEHKRPGFTDSEVKSIILYLLQGPEETFKDIRLKALITLYFLHGLRRIEIHRLFVEDVNLAQNRMNVLRKGADDKKWVTLFSFSAGVLRRYILRLDKQRSEAVKGSSGALFTSLSNNSRGKQLSPEGVYREVRAKLNEFGIDKDPHNFRIFFTTLLLRVFNGNIPKVMEFTGHVEPRTVMIYWREMEHKKSVAKVESVFRKLLGVS